MRSGSMTRVGGLSLIAAAVGFTTVFIYLAANFNYPDVLDGRAEDVLPNLVAMGTTGRAVWAIYALLPLLLVPAAVGAMEALRESAESEMRLAVQLASISALAMMLGLMRWPSIQWELAQAYASAATAQRETINAVFAGLNSYLGNYIGEFLGELCLNGFFFLVGVGMLRSQHFSRRLAVAGMFTAALGWLAMLRNITSLVGPISDVYNYLLPLWMIVLGWVFVLKRRIPQGDRAVAGFVSHGR